MYGIDFGARSPPIKLSAGTSIGAFLALMIAAGFSVCELTDYISKLRTEDMISSDIASMWGASSAAIFGAKGLRASVQRLLQRKSFAEDITLKQLFDKTQVCLDVYVT